MLSFFQSMFSLIHGQLYILTDVPGLAVVVRTLQASLILETVRELERLLTPVPARLPGSGSDTTVKPQLEREPETTAQCVKKLANKDTFWYLCAVLHTLLSEFSALNSSPSLSIAARINHENVDDQEVAEGVRTQSGADSQLLYEGISDALLKLITTCRKRVSSCCHGYLKAESEIHCALEVDREEEIGKAKDSHVRGSDTDGREQDEGQLLCKVDIDNLD